MKCPRVSCLQIVSAVFLLYCVWPSRFAKHYDYIPPGDIYDSLVKMTTRNLSLLRNYKCEYSDIIEDNKFLYKEPYRTEVLDTTEIRPGGEYVPADCAPQFSTAVIVVYRQRETQLNQFLIYMHNYLRKQQIHYRIFVVEQYDQKPFNRAKLFNIGAVYAMRLEYPCLVLHDVDLMPLHTGQMYACSARPRHMCASLDEFRFNLPYTGLFGGVVAIEADTYQKVNGMSNMFHGWGGEDDDLFGRLQNKNIEICRFAPAFSRYTMLRHAKEKPNTDRIAFLRNGHLRYHTDGLNSLVYEEKGYKLHKLFTHILVET